MKTRSAYTLFHLLVLLSILAILFALLLPALAKVREAANRASSQNNLKQIALGAHNYLSANNHFPPGNDGNTFSASAHLLPYVEQDNLFKAIDFNKPCDDDANKAARTTQIRLFVSPRDPQAVNADSGPTNYLYCAGSKPELKDNDGLFFQDSKMKAQDITDGFSNTVLAGETLRGDGNVKGMDVRRQHVALDKDALKKLDDNAGVDDFKNGKNIAADRGARWIDGRFLQGTFNSGRAANDARPDVTCAGLGGLSGLRSMDTVVNVAMGDGSVRSISAKIDPSVWKALATRAGGEVIDPNAL